MVEVPEKQLQTSSNPEVRFLTQLNAQIEIYGKNGKAVAKVSNLSKTGAMLELIQTKVLPIKGEILQITILLSELKKAHKVSAEVIWCHGLSFGVQFLAKDLAQSKAQTQNTQTPQLK